MGCCASESAGIQNDRMAGIKFEKKGEEEGGDMGMIG